MRRQKDENEDHKKGLVSHGFTMIKVYARKHDNIKGMRFFSWKYISRM
jgi:hypothetical protein